MIRIFTVSMIVPDLLMCQGNSRVCPSYHFDLWEKNTRAKQLEDWTKQKQSPLIPDIPYGTNVSFHIIVRNDHSTSQKSGMHLENRNAPDYFLVFIRSAKSVIVGKQWNSLSGILPAYEKCQVLKPLKLGKFVERMTRHSHIQLFPVLCGQVLCGQVFLEVKKLVQRYIKSLQYSGTPLMQPPLGHKILVVIIRWPH